MAPTIRAAYRERLRVGELVQDSAQAEAVEALARLEGELNAQSEPGFAAPFLHRRREAAKGVYLFGPVGRGKSMLMDLFFEGAPVSSKRRVHFHAFMAEVHGAIDAWRKGDASERKAQFGTTKGDDPIAPTGERIAQSARLLCFDEFHVNDIADAMILGRLFEVVFARGVVVVATSNRAPDDLYQDGLNRQLFLPFIETLKSRMQVVRVGGPKDFRFDRLRGRQVYFAPITPQTERAFNALWTSLIEGAEETGETLSVLGREIRLPCTVGGSLRASFASLCGAALGAQDYLAIARRYHTVLLEDVPRLGLENRNEAARLVSLIDALYEARTRVAMLAEAEPQGLYVQGDGAFEFQRTASRLEEMRSAAYLDETDER